MPLRYKTKKRIFRILVCLLRVLVVMSCATYFLPRMPVHYFHVSDGDDVVLAAALPAGGSFVTTYIHSVQLTPVIDDYRICNGKIWGWEERIQSHNAGLPFDAPKYGRMIYNAPWMTVQGGRHAHDRIVYRVGTADLGQNVWNIPPFPNIEAYKKYSGKRLFMHVSMVEARKAKTIGLSDSR